MRDVDYSTDFKKGFKRMSRRGCDPRKMHEAIFKLADDIPLPPRMKDHPLKGKWSGYRDCHLEPDWVLIYKLTDELLTLAATGTHSDIFG